MKTRNDFVSNSSSSSFIVMHSDNKHGVLLDPSLGEDGKLSNFTLHEYLHHFWRREFIPYEYCWSKDAEAKVQFVTDQKFVRLFADNQCAYSLPESTRDIWNEIVKAKALREQHEKKMYDEHDYSHDSVVEMLKTEDKLFDMILDKVEKALVDTFGNETFDYAEVSDNYDEAYENDPNCDYNDDVGRVEARIDYINSLKQLKFAAREFNNH